MARTPLIVRQSDGLAALWASAGTDPDLGGARSVLRKLRRLYLLGAVRDEAASSLAIPIIRIDPAAQPAWRPGRTANATPGP